MRNFLKTDDWKMRVKDSKQAYLQTLKLLSKEKRVSTSKEVKSPEFVK